MRSFARHIDNEELDALVPSSARTGEQSQVLFLETLNEVERHVKSCADCSRKVSQYRILVNQLSNAVGSKTAPPGVDCPKEGDVNWFEVAAGVWPELKATQLVAHAALCDHCGPLLRAAASLNSDANPEEEKLLAELKAPSRPHVAAVERPASLWSLRWLVPVAALLLIVGVLGTKPSSLPSSFSGPQFAQFAVSTHRQHEQGRLALDIHSDSQLALNEWLKAKSPFSLALPASPAAPGEERPYRLEGARLVRFGGSTAAFIAYHIQMLKFQTPQAQTGDASLVVVPNSVAVASGGVESDFPKVTFHYAMVQNYRVVTWSLHGLTYALVSQEANSTQSSCMVCHSQMRDRDLSHTPTPLSGRLPEPLLQ